MNGLSTVKSSRDSVVYSKLNWIIGINVSSRINSIVCLGVFLPFFFFCYLSVSVSIFVIVIFYFCHKRWLKMVENYVKSQRANYTYHLYTISSNVRKALDRLITCKNWWYHVFSHSWMLRWQEIPLFFNLFCCVFYLLHTTLTQKVWDEHQESEQQQLKNNKFDWMDSCIRFYVFHFSYNHIIYIIHEECVS